MRRASGEIVEVQGGHILRSISRKDRHSKVCTAKGPRDRRVRLAANTAIQFYDVQDRLGYDRPSKAVDWLIKNAKAAIDELAQLPAWHPSSVAENSSKDPMPPPEQAAFSFSGSGGKGRASSSLVPPSLVSDNIADTIRSFFPVNSTSDSPELFSPKSRRSQDLCLSLQSIQDTTFDQPDPIQHHPISFDAALAGFAEQNQRIVSWNLPANGGVNGAIDCAFNMAPVLFGQGHLSTHRGTLQSSNTTLLRPWIDSIDQQMHQTLFPAVSSIGFTSGGGRGFPGFHIPARIHGEEELNCISDKPPFTSSASHLQ